MAQFAAYFPSYKPPYCATWWPNARNMLRATMFHDVAPTCCIRLARARAMKSQVLHTLWCNITEAAGEYWAWSLSRVKGSIHVLKEENLSRLITRDLLRLLLLMLLLVLTLQQGILRTSSALISLLKNAYARGLPAEFVIRKRNLELPRTLQGPHRSKTTQNEQHMAKM